MYELERMSEQEKIKISVQCEPFFLVSKKPRVFKNLFDEFRTHFDTSKYDKEIWLVVTAITKAIKYGNNGTRFSFSKGHFVEANKVHNQKLNLNRALSVLTLLEDKGYIDIYKGYYHSPKDRMASCVLFKEKLTDIIDIKLAKKFGAKRDPLSYIEVKDINNKSVLLSVQDFRGYSAITKFMEEYNNLLAQSLIQMPDTNTGELVKCITVYKRVFSGDLSSAGRFYAMGKFQIYESELRRLMLIDNSLTTEVDYSNLHPRLLYTLEGIKLPYYWDAYSIPSLDWVHKDKKERRSFLKICYLAVLFSESKEQAIKSVLSKANKQKKNIEVKDKVGATKVVEAVLEKNDKISHYFFKERLWAKLQNMDSILAKSVISQHVEQKKICLGWHDSFIVKREDQQFLMDSMKHAWYSMFGTYMNFKIDIEY